MNSMNGPGGRRLFNDFLAARRTALGLTQRQLDEMLGLTEGTIQQMESRAKGDIKVTVLSRFFDFCPDLLVRPDGTPYSYKEISQVIEGSLNPFTGEPITNGTAK